MTDEGFSLDREILNYLSEHPGETANAITNFIKLEFGRFDVKYVRQRIEGLVNAGKVNIKINTRAPTQAPLLFVAESKPAKVEPVKVEKKTEMIAQEAPRRKEWTKAEEKYLKINFGFQSPKEIGLALSKTESAVNHQIETMVGVGTLKRRLPGHIDTRQAAKILGLATNRVADLAHSGSLPAKRMHWRGGYGTWLYLKSDVEAFKQSRLAKKPIKPTTQKQATLDTPAPVVKTPPAIIGSPRDSIEGETPAAYAAFCVYLDAPAGEQKARDIAQKLYGTATPTQVQRMRHWASDHHWAERAKAWIARKAELEQIVNIPSHKATAADFPVKSRSKPEIVELKPKPATVPEKLKPEIREIIRPAKRYGPWTHEEDTVVLEKYLTMTPKMISELIYRTPSAITGRIYYLKNHPKSRKNAPTPILNLGPWTAEEDRVILDNCRTMTNSQIEDLINRTSRQITDRLRELMRPHREQGFPDPTLPTVPATIEGPIPEVVEEIPEPVIEPATVICPPPVAAEPKSGWWGKISKIKEILINGVKL